MSEQLDLLEPVAHCSNCDPACDEKNMRILLGCSVEHLQGCVNLHIEMDLSGCTPEEAAGELWHVQHRRSLMVAALRRRKAGEHVRPRKTLAQDRAHRVKCGGRCGKMVHRQGEDGGKPWCAFCLRKRRRASA